MLPQLILGSIVTTLSIFIEIAFIFTAIRMMARISRSHVLKSRLLTLMFYLAGITLWLLFAFTIVTWIWALTFLSLNTFSSLEESVYFSMVAFTSLGFGDVVLEKEWRILSGIVAANGLLLFGLNTAVLVETLRQVLESVKGTVK